MAKTIFHIDTKLYENVLNLINEQHFVEQKGNIKDFSFLYDDAWLYDTAVIDNLVYNYGQWDVELVFVQYILVCFNNYDYVSLSHKSKDYELSSKFEFRRTNRIKNFKTRS